MGASEYYGGLFAASKAYKRWMRKWRIAENKKAWIRQFFFDIQFQDWLIYKLATINPIIMFGPEAGKRFRDVLPPPRNIQETIRLYGLVQQILLGRICPACLDEGWVSKMRSEIGDFGSCRIFRCSRGHVFKVDDEAGTWLEAYIKAMTRTMHTDHER